MSCIKRANKQEKEHVQRLDFSLLQTFWFLENCPWRKLPPTLTLILNQTLTITGGQFSLRKLCGHQPFLGRKSDSIFATLVIEIAKFESLLRFFVLILENTLQRTIHKAMTEYVKWGNSKIPENKGQFESAEITESAENTLSRYVTVGIWFSNNFWLKLLRSFWKQNYNIIFVVKNLKTEQCSSFTIIIYFHYKWKDSIL